MAITTSAVANTFKNQLLSATHNFTQTSGNHFYLALYTSSATLGKSTTDYTTSGESSGTGYGCRLGYFRLDTRLDGRK